MEIQRLIEIGRVRRGDRPFGNCLRKIHYLKTERHKVYRNLVFNVPVVGPEWTVFDLDDLVEGLGKVAVPVAKDSRGVYTLRQQVYGPAGNDTVKDSNLPLVRLHPRFSWLPQACLWALPAGERTLSWEIHTPSGATGWCLWEVEDDSILVNGTRTSMTLSGVRAGMEDLFQLKGKDGPPGEYTLVYNAHSNIPGVENTMWCSSTSGKYSFPIDPCLPYLDSSQAAAKSRNPSGIPTDSFGPSGDDECRQCSFQTKCWRIDHRIPEHYFRKKETPAMVSIRKSRV